jgi:hypothetical protein
VEVGNGALNCSHPAKLSVEASADTPELLARIKPKSATASHNADREMGILSKKVNTQPKCECNGCRSSLACQQRSQRAGSGSLPIS